MNGTLEEALPENHTSRKTILGHCVVTAMTMGEGEQRVRQQPTELNIDELVGPEKWKSSSLAGDDELRTEATRIGDVGIGPLAPCYSHGMCCARRTFNRSVG